MPITIGIPFHNAEPFLADAIRSVFVQSYQDWELILIDDGSTDRSREIACAVKDPRVRVICDGENRHLSYRLNQIVSEAKYDLIARMDADDLISVTRLEKQLLILDNHPEIDLVTTGVCSLTNDNRPIGVRFDSAHKLITGRRLLLGQCSVVHAAILGRKSWFVRNPYDVTLLRAQDYELWLRAYSKNDFNIYILGEPLYYYREEQNVTANRLLKAYANQRYLYKIYGELWLNTWELQVTTAKSYCKSLTVKILSYCDKMNILLSQRNTAITDGNLLEHFTCEIDKILKTRVPGLDIIG